MKQDKKSIYTKDGTWKRKFIKAKTVGQLRKQLEELPGKLPIEIGYYCGVVLAWANVGKEDECLLLEDSDSEETEY